MATINWKNSRKATVKPSNSKVKAFEITIKKSAGGLSYNLLNSDKIVIKSGATVQDLQGYASEYYRKL